MQAAVRQVLGLEPVQFPKFYAQEDAAKRCFAAGYRYFWRPQNRWNQWHLDAFSIDPRVLSDDPRGIAFAGSPFPFIEADALNASVGRTPVMMFYLAAHADHGTRVFFPYTGAKAGKKAAYVGYEYWTDKLTPDQVTQLKAMAYYNPPAAAAQVRAAGCDAANAKFDVKFFKVLHFFLTSNA